ncbi:MAG: hypothetical protein AAGI44_09875 [Pseudomonadota bacterium]
MSASVRQIILANGGTPVAGRALGEDIDQDNVDPIIKPLPGDDPIVLRIRRAMADEDTGSAGDGPLDEDGVYRPTISEGGFSSMGFEIVRKDGARDLFFYPSMGDVTYTKDAFAEYIYFSHRTKAVILKGMNLVDILDKLKRHTLTTLFQYPDGDVPFRKFSPMITYIEIKSVDNHGRND